MWLFATPWTATPCNSLRPHGLQYDRLPCTSPTPRVCPNLCLLSQWCHPTISSSVVPFSFCLQSCPASGSSAMSQFFASGGQYIYLLQENERSGCILESHLGKKISGNLAADQPDKSRMNKPGPLPWYRRQASWKVKGLREIRLVWEGVVCLEQQGKQIGNL